MIDPLTGCSPPRARVVAACSSVAGVTVPVSRKLPPSRSSGLGYAGRQRPAAPRADRTPAPRLPVSRALRLVRAARAAPRRWSHAAAARPALWVRGRRRRRPRRRQARRGEPARPPQGRGEGREGVGPGGVVQCRATRGVHARQSRSRPRGARGGRGRPVVVSVVSTGRVTGFLLGGHLDAEREPGVRAGLEVHPADGGARASAGTSRRPAAGRPATRSEGSRDSSVASGAGRVAAAASATGRRHVGVVGQPDPGVRRGA